MRTTRCFQFDHGLAAAEQGLPGIPDLLQAHGQHVVAQRETPVRQPLLCIHQGQVPDPRMVMVGQGSARQQGPFGPGDRAVRGPAATEQSLVCHNQQTAVKMQLSIQVNL